MKRSNRIIWLVLFLVVLGTSVVAQARTEIYLSPKGGFSPYNNQRTITLLDGRKVKAGLNNALLDLIQRVPAGGTIKIAMYSFSFTPIQDALIEAALNRGVQVKLILDGIVSWTARSKKALLEKVAAAQKQAQELNKVFDFQIRQTSSKRMESRGRDSFTPDGTHIFGLMHEKFGVIYKPDSRIPVHAFGGCGNITWGADLYYAEDRIIFWNQPSVARQFAEQFARIWNEYGVDVTPDCETEPYIPACSLPGEVQIIFNTELKNEEEYYRIDKALIKMMRRVNRREGTIDLLLFNLTHRQITEELLQIATRNPQVQIRMVLDQCQIEESEDRVGVMGPYLEQQIAKRGLKNFHIRYKWRSNAYGFDEEKQKFCHVHMRSLLLHHKTMVVDHDKMAIGTYNWSASSEFRNFEHMMFFDGRFPGHQQVIDHLNAEFKTIWNSLKSEGPVKKYIAGCQVIEGPRGRALKAKILQTLQKEGAWQVLRAMETNVPEARYDDSRKQATLAEICKHTGFSPEKVQQRLAEMLAVGLMVKWTGTDGKTHYGLAD